MLTRGEYNALNKMNLVNVFNDDRIRFCSLIETFYNDIKKDLGGKEPDKLTVAFTLAGYLVGDDLITDKLGDGGVDTTDSSSVFKWTERFAKLIISKMKWPPFTPAAAGARSML